jgi:trehalose-6-phosphatase
LKTLIHVAYDEERIITDASDEVECIQSMGDDTDDETEFNWTTISIEDTVHTDELLGESLDGFETVCFEN